MSFVSSLALDPLLLQTSNAHARVAYFLMLHLDGIFKCILQYFNYSLVVRIMHTVFDAFKFKETFYF